MAARKGKRMTIPDDVVGEIHQWLPPKSLGRFQCVSKKWRCMILDEISKRNSKEENVLVVSRSSIGSIDFSKPESEIKAVTLIEFPVKESFYVGCANGLVLYLDSENRALVLFNPWTLTRQPIKIPHPNPLTRDSYSYGFGYNDNNYVIVIIDLEDRNGSRRHRNGFRWSSETRNWVPFSIKLNPTLSVTGVCVNGTIIWKRVFGITLSLTGLCVDGCVYWEKKDCVICFNMKICNFKVIKKPPESRRQWPLHLVVLGDRLAAMELNFDLACTHVWELDERMQWIKIMTIPGFVLSPEDAVKYRSFYSKKTNIKSDTIFHHLLTPVLLLKNGNCILLSKMLGIEDSNGNKGTGPWIGAGVAASKFYLYNEEVKTITPLETQGTANITYSDRIIPCKNNQISPDINFKNQDLF